MAFCAGATLEGGRPDAYVTLVRLRLRELQPFDLRGVELAAVRRVEHDGLADDGRVEAKPAITADVASAGTDVARRADLEAQRVVEVVALHPSHRNRGKLLALREPDEPDPELIVLDGDGLHLAAVDVALTFVQDLHLTALESLDGLCG